MVIITIHKNLQTGAHWSYTKPLGINPTQVTVKMISYCPPTTMTDHYPGFQNASNVFAVNTSLPIGCDHLAIFGNGACTLTPNMSFPCHHDGGNIHFEVVALKDTAGPIHTKHLQLIGDLAIMLDFE